MKHLFCIIALLLVSSVFHLGYADEPNPAPDPEPETPEYRLPKKKIPTFPGIALKPSSSYIGLKYDRVECALLFTLPADVEYIDVEAENLDSHIIYAGSVWAENPVWDQALPAGEYIITCTADNGDIYEGYIVI